MSRPSDDPAVDRRALELFDELVEMPPAERQATLALVRAGDPELAERVSALLSADATGSPLLGAREVPRSGTVPRGEQGMPGTLLGPWRLLRRIGQGGMGEVWEAERTEGDFAQRVAVKIVSRELTSPSLRARFARERRILARLDHPSIARLVDGGVANDGTPWLAMELVEGLPLTEHCRSLALPLEAACRLLLAVAEAVDHAHRALVIHRDLKPSNVLVDRAGRVRLLDFGIAKLIEDGETGTESSDFAAAPTTALTRLEERLLTPSYASPEQVRGEPVSMATDVWALGVLLFELLAGRRPFDRPGASRVEIEHAVLEREPGSPWAGNAGRFRPGRRLRRDLEAITARALAKVPAQRYPSVDRFAADLASALAAHPIAARRMGFGTRSLRFLRRHRIPAALVALTLCSMAVGAGVSLRQARARALEARHASELGAFLSRLFEVASPEVSGGATVTARDLLDEGARRLDGELASDPKTRAAFARTLARLYQELGEGQRAIALARTARDLTVAAEGVGSSPAAEARALVTHVLSDGDDLDAAERELLAAESAGTERGTPGARALLEARAALLQRRGKPLEAVEIQKQLVAALVADPDPSAALAARAKLAEYLTAAERSGEAIEILRDVVVAATERFGPEHPATARARANLGIALSQADHTSEGVAELRAALAIHRRAQGAAHRETVSSAKELAAALRLDHQIDEASEVLETAARALAETGAERSYLYGNVLNERAILLHRVGRYRQAADVLERVVAIWSALLGPDHPSTLQARSNRVACFVDEGRFAEAEPLARDVLTRQRKVATPVALTAPLNTLGILLVDLDRPAEAEPLFRESLAINLAANGESHDFTIYSRTLVATAALARGALAAATEQLDHALATIDGNESLRARPWAALWTTHAVLLCRTGQFRNAVETARRALRTRLENLPVDNWRVAESRLALAEALAGSGERSAARSEAQQALAVLERSRGELHPLTRRARALLAS